jgi:hypothetical protein
LVSETGSLVTVIDASCTPAQTKAQVLDIAYIPTSEGWLYLA